MTIYPKNYAPSVEEIRRRDLVMAEKVSPLEVIGSMAGKVGKRIDEGFLGKMARGFLMEQAQTSFGMSGKDFGEKYFMFGDNSAANFVGHFVGAGWDVGCAYFAANYLLGHDLNDFEKSMAVYFGLKVATQVGAYVKRKYDAEKTSLKQKKLDKLNRMIN